MTATHLLLFASLAGAALFFAAGVALAALRPRRVTDDTAPTDVRTVSQFAELTQLRDALAAAEATVRTQATAPREAEKLRSEADVLRGYGERFRAEAARQHAERARHKAEAERPHAESERHRTEAERQRVEADRHRAEAERLRGEVERHRGDVERLQKEATAAAATNQELRRTAEERAKQLERTRTEAVSGTTELAQLQKKLGDVERQLADKTASVRDLSTENEQLKGRLRAADALRAEYVRLRPAPTDSEFLKSEIARLQQELRTVRVEALGAHPPLRPARGTDRQGTAVQRTIGESLARVIEKFADAGTRSSALADTQGFPLASSGADAVALAAYGAHLYESASRAKEYLPVGAPTAIEIIDANGVRVSVWALEMGADRLVLANLAVSPVDVQRVESTLGDLGQILAPSGTPRVAHP